MKKIIILLILLISFIDAKEIKWKLATTWGTTTTPHIGIAKEMSELVSKMTNGNFKIKVHSSNIHKAPFSIFDMVKNNSYEMGHTASYYWKGKDLATVPLASMPFGMTTDQFHSWFKYGGGEELMNAVYSNHGMRSFLGGNTGKQMIWFKKEIKKPKDLEGLKIRMPGYAGEVMHRAGSLVVTLPSGELYTALETNLINALEWCSPGTDIKMGFNDIAKYYYVGFHENSTELQYLVNLEAWNSLSKEYQEILKVAMEISANNFYHNLYDENVKAWNTFTSKNRGIRLMKFSDEIINVLKKHHNDLLQEHSKENQLFKLIVDSQKRYMDESDIWNKINTSKY